MRLFSLIPAVTLALALAAPSPAAAEAARGPDTCLLLVTQNISKGGGGFHLHFRISNKRVTIKPGDRLAYDMYLLSDQPEPKGGVAVNFEGGGSSRGTFAMDGATASGGTLVQEAKGRWLSRTVPLHRLAGKTTSETFIMNEWPAEGVYVQFIDNVHIRHADGSRTVLYENGEPETREILSKNGYSQEPILAIVPRAQVQKAGERALRKLDALSRFGRDLDRQRMRAASSKFVKELDWVSEAVRREGRADLLKAVEAARKQAPNADSFSGSPDDFMKSIDDAAHTLSHTHPLMAKYTGHLVGHAHIDFQWLWEWPQGVEVTRSTFVQAMKFMDEFKEFTFSQSSAALYHAMETHHPDVWKRLKTYVRRGQWEIVGGRWAEGDLNVTSEESNARHFLYAQRYFRENFGTTAKVGWEPDTFGHSFQVPQLLRLAGIDSYYFCRAGRQQPLFTWEGLDGSRVLAFDESQTESWYNSDVTGKEFDQLLAFSKRYNANDLIWVYGVGNHGGGPTRENILTILDWKKKGHLPRARFSTATQFFDALKKQPLQGVAVIKEDLNSVFEGVYTTHGDMKRWNRDAESLTVAAETAAALASRFGYKYPRQEFVDTWRDVLWNHHHDTITGTGIHAAYALSKRLYEKGIASSKRILNEAAEVIAGRSTAKAGDLVVLNTLGWRRDALVAARPASEAPAGELVAVGPDGAARPVQKTAEGELAFVAKDVPAFGYRVYRLVPAAAGGAKGNANGGGVTCRNGGRAISTARYDIELDPKTGAIAKLYDKSRRRSVLGGPGNDLQIHWEEPHGMSAWSIGNFTRAEPLGLVGEEKQAALGPSGRRGLASGLEVIECGPVRARVRAKRAWGKSAFLVDTIAYADLDLVEVRLDVDWQEKGDSKAGSPFLKAHFPLGTKVATVRASIPFGDMDRPANGREFPALTWVDAGGVALFNDSKHGHSAQGDGVLALSLLRASYDPDPEPDVGRHVIRYALWPHAGGPHEAGVPRRGIGFNTAPVAVWAKGAGAAAAGLGAEASFLTLEGSGAVPTPTALKLAEDGSDLILRMFASSPANAEARLGGALKIGKATVVNLVEDRIGDTSPTAITLRPYEIKTVRLAVEK